MDEFALIRRFFRERLQPPSVILGPGDDGALLAPTPGQQLVMTLDTLVSGRHFPEDFPAFDIGWRSLAVNLSDLAAMGAIPRWCLLSLSLPQVDEAWLASFCDGFFTLADQHGISLVGGDTVRGPLAISVQASGEVPPGQALLRSGAKAGDRICLAGVPGLASAGLQAWQAGSSAQFPELIEAFARPQPQLQLATQLRGIASACLDISDGLLADLQHILEESGALGADIQLSSLPGHPALAAWGNEAQRLQVQLAGGDDYLLLFTVPPAHTLESGWHCIGEVSGQSGVRLWTAQGQLLQQQFPGWNHFSAQH